jgi:hypothetical protein
VHFATLPIGPTTVTLLSPVTRTRSDDDPAAGNTTALAEALRSHLAIRGEGVFSAAIDVAHAAQARELPLSLSHGARLEFVHAPGS